MNRSDLPDEVLAYYDSEYATADNPHPKRIAVYEEDGQVYFGKNPKHTEVTNLQNDLHREQRADGLRTEPEKKKKKSKKCDS